MESINSELGKKYGVMTAIAMVIGNVIGSGIFFKAEKIQTVTGGNLPIGILAWLIGGLIMIFCANTFAVLATKYSKSGGAADYAEVMVGPKYAYYVGWFMATIYFPSLVSALAWVASRYICVLFNWDITGGACMAIAGFLIMFFFIMNVLAPKIAGKFQVSTTVIKLIPLILMAIVGTIVGLKNGMLVQNMTSGFVAEASSHPLLSAVIATSFAYEGWISATSIGSELKDSKKNLPLALTVGTFIVILVYILYYIGLAGTVSNTDMIESGVNSVRTAFSYIFKDLAATIVVVFVVISTMGTLNGMMMGSLRAFYSLAVKNQGPRPKLYKQVDPVTQMPLAASLLSLLVHALWFLYFFGANLAETPWFGPFSFDSSEVPAVTTYALYIPIFIAIIIKEKDLSFWKRIIIPILGIIGAIMMIAAGIGGYGITIVYYLIIFAVIMIIGALLRKNKGETLKE